MSEKKQLIVPINIHAIWQKEDKAVIGHDMDFESLPYYDKKLGLDVNPDVPYLAESVTSRPFEDTNFLLKQGVHLNWDFPQFLKSTKYKAEKPTVFPPVPTRWLINRYSAKEKLQKQWVVESDALLKDLKGAKIYEMAQTSTNISIHSGERPYTYMGKTTPLETWKKNHSYPNYERWTDKHNEPLTAMGWGSPSFDIFYPNCRGAFGFHDPGGTSEHSYKVIGWYGDLKDDYWIYYLNKKKAETDKNKKKINWNFDTIDKIEHLDAKQKAGLKKEQFEKQIKEQLGIKMSIPETENVVDLAKSSNWSGMLCCGKAQWIDNTFLQAHKDETLFAMGNTPIEALSAMLVEKSSISKAVAAEIKDLKDKMSASGVDVQAGIDIDGDKDIDVDTDRYLRVPIREKFEDRLSAILMGDRLKSKKLDIGPKFREFRHADEFVASEGGLRWMVERISDNPHQEVSGKAETDKKLPPGLPDSVYAPLAALNEAQRAYDKAAMDLESVRFELYSDWYRYMHVSYPPPGETEDYIEVSDMRAMIQAKSLKKVRDLTKVLGHKEPNSEVYTGLAAVVAQRRTTLEDIIKQVNQELKKQKDIEAEFHWELQHRPAARFWEPAPPSLVIALPREASAQGVTDEEASRLKKTLPCQLVQQSSTTLKRGNDFSLDSVLDNNSLVWEPPQYANTTDLPIFRGEWQAEVYPVASMHPVTRSSGNYHSNYINNNYLLGENEPDLDDNASLDSPLALLKSGNIYTGSNFVNQKLDDRYRYLLDHYLELEEVRKQQLSKFIENEDNAKSPLLEEKKKDLDRITGFAKDVEAAKDFLQSHDLLVITLNGFNAALLQRHESIQLNPADPLGFSDYQAFAEDVANALKNNTKGVSPDPHNPFLPIRNGALQIITIRLIDVFGGFMDFNPQDVITAISMEVHDHPDWVRLPPRIAQAARWNFRFLQANTEQLAQKPIEAQSQGKSSPIFGWIVPNLLDHSFDFFQADGTYLGSVKRKQGKSNWEGEELGTGLMSQIKDWLLDAAKELEEEEGEKFFLQYFMEDVEEAMDNIHPNDREGQSAYSVLMGRPMAVVRVGIELELKGTPAANISWGELYRNITGLPQSTNDFEKIKFPYRIGEYRQRNDGLIGYWTIEENDQLSAEFSLNDAISGHLNIEKLKGGPKDDFLKRKNEEWRVQDEKGRSLFEFLLEEEDETIKKQDLIQPYIRQGSRVWKVLVEKGFVTEETPFEAIQHYSEADRISISAADEMQQFVALMDPHGLIHLSSGIQPVKAIQLPGHFIEKALEQIEVTFLTAPLLSPEKQLEISLPKEKNFAWAWREPNKWPADKGKAIAPLETPEAGIDSSQLNPEWETSEEDIDSFQLTAKFPDRVVIREGQLVLKHKSETTED